MSELHISLKAKDVWISSQTTIDASWASKERFKSRCLSLPVARRLKVTGMVVHNLIGHPSCDIYQEIHARSRETLILLRSLSQNPVFELRKWYINQNKTRVLSPLPTTYVCFTISILHYVIYSCLPFTTTSPPHVSLCLLCHYSIIRTKTNRYITPLLRSRLGDISIHFPRQSNGRNSGGVWVFLMELFTWSWSSLYDFISTFPSPFFERLTSPFNKVLKFVTSPPRVKYLFYLLYVGLGSRVDNSIIWFLRLLLKCGFYIRCEI